MKRIGKPMKFIIYNFSMIVLFFIVYLLLIDQLATSRSGDIGVLDVFNLSVTIQTAIGITLIYPTAILPKIAIILQQLFLIFGNLLIFHI
jgi:hypothetical protein